MATPTTHTTAPPACTVQRVAKASSDELLRKFADPDAAKQPSPPPRRPLALRRKRSSRRVASGLSAREHAAAPPDAVAAAKRRRSSGGSAEWKSGLLLPTAARKQGPKYGRRIGTGRLDDAAGMGLLLAALERAWRKTVAGASKMFVERHRTDHVLLISDMV